MGAGMGEWGWGFGGLFMILWWILIIVGIVALVKWVLSAASGNGRLSGKSAMDILKERYARGEITREEFEQRRADLDRS